MTLDKARQLDAVASQLAEALMTAAICEQEIRNIVRAELDDDAKANPTRGALAPAVAQHGERPLIDESTLSVLWKTRRLHLGNTLVFRMMERIARRPNQYVTHLDLIRDVWDDKEPTTDTIRSLARDLRRKLSNGGMADLATAIRGHNGRYILDL